VRSAVLVLLPLGRQAGASAQQAAIMSYNSSSSHASPRHLSPINIITSPVVPAEARIHPPATFSTFFASLALIWTRADRIATPQFR
jgi:hypothetical protein